MRRYEGSRTGNAFRFPRVTGLYEAVSFLPAPLPPVNHYLVTHCQEVVVGPEGSRADRIQLD